MKKLILMAAFSLSMIFTAIGSVTGQLTSDFLYSEVYSSMDTVLFCAEDSLVIGEIVLLKPENDIESQIQMKVTHGDKDSYFFIFISNGKLRVAQEKVLTQGNSLPIENVIYFPLGKGRLRMLNYNTSIEMTSVEKAEHFGLIIAFVEDKFDIKIKY